MLAPSLCPGDVAIMGNLSSHKVHGVHQAIKAKKAFLLYLPPYSPDLNTSERTFSKLKALLRKVAARTREELERGIANAMDLFSPQECLNVTKHAGYDRYQS